jgi:hypothetical protein
MKLVSAVTGCWLGLCRKVPVIHASAIALPEAPGACFSPRQGIPGNTMSTGGIRRGIHIAAESIRSLLHEKQLLAFPLLAGIVILGMILAERWNLSLTSASFAASGLISVPYGNTFLILFDLRLFLIEAAGLAGFTFLLAALVHYRSLSRDAIPVTLRSSFSVPDRHAVALAGFSLVMALVATVLLEITAQNQMTGSMESAVTHAMFWLPYAYYFDPNGIFTTLFFSFRMIVANAILFMAALYVVPVIVLEKRGLLSALAGSTRLMQRTWQELLGCLLVFGTIILAVVFIGLVIGQSPALLNNDFDFFLQASRGQMLMTAACYGFLVSCGVLMALGSTVLGVAVTDLYACGTGTGKAAVTEDRNDAGSNGGPGP